MRVALLALLVGCGSCGEDELVEGDHPYVRCALRQPEVRIESHEGVSLHLAGRVLDVRGLTQVHAFAVGDTAGGDLPAGPVVVLGGFARTEELGRAVLDQIGSRLAFFVAGGADDPDVIDDIVEEPHHVDLRGVHVLALEGFDWIVLPGAADGRYSLGDESCGYGDADVDALAATLEGRERARMWLSWQAPEGISDLGFEGVHVGDPRLDLAVGGIFAFPGTAESSGTGVQHAATVPTWGGFSERHDGAVVPPGVLEIHIEAEGLRTTLRPL